MSKSVWAGCGPPQCSLPQGWEVQVPNTTLKDCLSHGAYAGEYIKPDSFYPTGQIYTFQGEFIGTVDFWKDEKLCVYSYRGYYQHPHVED